MTVTKETATLIRVFKEPLTNLLKEIGSELEHFIDNGLSFYIETQSKKFKTTKTFLYRNERVNFYDTFFPLELEYKNNRIIADERVVETLFQSSNCITVVGSAGSGKTMLTKHIFLACIKNKAKVPILLELRSLNDFDGSITDALAKIIVNSELSQTKTILERLLNLGNFLFILDGFDEIYSTNKQKVIHDLELFIDRHPNNLYLITTRPGVSIENLPRFDNFGVCTLNAKQIIPFIEKQFKKSEDKELSKKIIATIVRPENNDYLSYLGSPLLLSMFILTYNSYPELPKSKGKFYWNVFDTLCTKHDSFTKKGGFQHERRTGLQNEELENVLKWFAYISLFEGHYIFDSQYLNEKLKVIKDQLELKCDIGNLIHDLTISISIIIIDGLEYRFPHKSMQEYFAALLIKEQSQENKERIYSEKLNWFYQRATGGHENFWNLCLEIDKTTFLNFFIIKYLNEFISETRGETELDTIRNVIKHVGYGHNFVISPSSEIEITALHSRVRVLHGILSFLNMPSYEAVFSLLKYDSKKINKWVLLLTQQGVIKKVETSNHEEEIGDYRFYWENDFQKMYPFIKDIGMDRAILGLLEKVKNKVSEIITELNEEETSKTSLLDL